MQFLSSFHIVLTCSFVVLLAYLLSRFFTYLAHSVIHGSDKERSRSRTEGSSRGRRSESFLCQIGKEDPAVMARLQEQDENEEEEDAYRDSELRAASKYELGGGIFDDDQENDVRRDDHGKQASWDNEEGMKEEEGMDAADNGRRYGGGGNSEYKDSAEDGEMRKGDAVENAGWLDNFQGGEEEKGTSNKSVLADAQGSSSLQQRLPPTWSDLERMVNLSSKKLSSPPSVSPVPEY